MRVARFSDGTGCRLQRVDGDHFDARDGEMLLFEFPDGRLKTGAIGADGAEPFLEHFPIFAAVYDSESRIVSLEGSTLLN